MDRPFQHLIGDGIVWDNHTCMPLRTDDLRYMDQLARVSASGVDVITLNVAFGNQDTQSALAMLSVFRDWVLQRPNEYLLIERTEDVERAYASGRLGVCFDIEGMDALDGNTGHVQMFYDLGVRWMLATYNRTNIAGGGCLSEDEGLTDFGRDVIRAMNQVGMVVCGTHCGYRTAREMIDFSAEPVIFSHSNPRALWDHPRNIPDDLIKECAARGGVIGINGFGPFLGANDASTATYVAHIEYALDLVGDDHVGIGLDYVFDQEDLYQYIAADPRTFPPKYYSQGANMVEPWRLREVTSELIARGHSTVTLKKLLGGNHLRIANRVWR
jgi:membrane dipeptidase